MVDDDDSVVYLSDEEDFESAEEILRMMKNGILPPELQALHGMCLIGEGGSNFLAEKLIRAVECLDDECMDQKRYLIDHSSSDETSLELFRNAMAETLSKPAAYALLNDIVIKMNKEAEWSSKLLPIYEKYIEEIEKSDRVDVLQLNPSALSLFVSSKRNYYLKVLLAVLQMRLIKAENLMPKKQEIPYDKTCAAYKLVLAIIDTIYRYRTTLLQEVNKRDISNESKEVSQCATVSLDLYCFF